MSVHVALDLSQSTDYELRKLHEEVQSELAKRRMIARSDDDALTEAARRAHDELRALRASEGPGFLERHAVHEKDEDELPYTVEFVNEESRQCRYAAKTGLKTVVDAVSWINSKDKPFGGYYRVVRESNR